MDTNELSARKKLIDLLQHAYSGEAAAALAYRGHWRSLPDGPDRSRIREIEAEEWRHRKCIEGMLAALGSGPSARREWSAAVVGRALGLLCHVSGRLAPMYGAGRLESTNIEEYERAARLALEAGCREWTQDFLEMAEVEWEHERYFRWCVRRHRWARWIPLWPAPGPKDAIRASFRFRARATGLAVESPMPSSVRGPLPDVGWTPAWKSRATR
jgi:rubrerythrin